MDDYSVIQTLHRGLVSEVLLVEKKNMKGEKYVLKKIDKSLLKELNRLQEIQMEIHCMKKFEKFNFTPRYYTQFENSQFLYLVEEYIEGNQLWELSKCLGLVNRAFTYNVFFQLTDIVSKLHEFGVIHGDLKPENIILRKDGQIEVTDFASSKDTKDPSVEPALGGKFIGSVYYLSPEQVRRENMTEKSDIWSLGCIFYQLILGHPPFLGENEQEIFEQIENGIPYFPNQIFTPDERDLISKMLEKEPEKRISTNEIKQHPLIKSIVDRTLKELNEWEKSKEPVEKEVSFLINEANHRQLKNQEELNNFINEYIVSLPHFDEKQIKRLEYLKRQLAFYYKFEIIKTEN